MLATIWTSVQGVLTIVIMIAIGYTLQGRGWFDDKFSGALSKIIMRVALPCSIFMSMLTNFTLGKLTSLWVELVIAVAGMLVSYAIATVAVRLLRVPRGRRGLMITAICGGNTVFIGMPLNVALFGNASVPYLLVYYIVNTVLIWTLGVYIIAKDDPTAAHGAKASFDWRHLIPVPLYGFIVAIPFLLFGWQHVLPTFATTTLSDIGGLVTPLSLIYIGIMLRSFGLRSMALNADALWTLVGRFVFSPLVMFGVVALATGIFGASLPHLQMETLIVQSATPCLAVLPILANEYHGDVKYATSAVTLTTVFFVIVVPVIMLLVH